MEYLSPSVNIANIDYTTNTVNVSTRSAAFVGDFPNGPANQIVKVTTSQELTSIFGRPNDENYVDLLSAENFLAYNGSLFVVRSVNDASENARDADYVTAATTLKVTNYDNFLTQNLTDGTFFARYVGVTGNALKISVADAASFDAWAYKNQFASAPDANELHIVVVDATGVITGTIGTILETYQYASTVAGSKDLDGTSNYYETWINTTSNHIYVTDTPTAGDYQLAGGLHTTPTDGNFQTSWDMFANSEETDTPILFTGARTTTVSNYVINLAAERNDSIVAVSPELADVLSNDANRLDDVLSYRNALGTSTSFGVMDMNWKYYYDRYNDVYRWIPCNSDVAGLMAATTEAWDSPAGFNRGQLKNTVKLAWNPNKSERDELYRNNINTVVRFQGDGVVLYGDKTLQAKPSAFDRINVRRLFNFVNRTMKRTARYVLFDVNDAITRANFINMVKPLFEDIKGKRGLIDYEIICDETNNPASVIDANRLVCTVRLQPTRSTNYIDINIVADRTSETVVEIL